MNPDSPVPVPPFTRPWHTPRQAMKFLGMTKSTFWRRVHEGAIIARQDGPRTYRINHQALLDYLEENKTFDPGT